MRRMKAIGGLAMAALCMAPETAVLGQAPATPAISPMVRVANDPQLQAKLRAADAWLSRQLERQAIPASAFAIVHDQELVWAKAYGKSDPAGRRPMTVDTRFSICSVTKLFTSLAAMQLRDAGELDLDKPVADYVPWFAIHDVARPDGPVTARGIMSHVAGLPRDIDLPYWSTDKFPDLDALKTTIARQSSLYRTFDHYQYSNLGMSVLGYAVADASGETYQQYITDHLIRPIGMTSTTASIPVDLYGRGLAVGYAVRNGKGERRLFPPYSVDALAPAAGVASTITDLARFASWQFRVLDGKDETVIRSATLRDMQRVHWQTPDKPDETWGLGFQTMIYKGKSFVGHEGYCPGYQTAIFERPQDHLAYIAFIDVNDVAPGDLVRRLYDFTADDITRAAKGDPAPTPIADLSAFEGLYSLKDYDRDLYFVEVGGTLRGYPTYDGDPVAHAETLKPVGGGTFHIVLPDGSEAESVRFELDGGGHPIRLWQTSLPMDRVAVAKR